MIKKLNDYPLTKKVKDKFLVKVRSFSGSKVISIVDHVKPTIRDDKLDHFILHTGTNDLQSEKNIKPNCKIYHRIRNVIGKG